VCAMSSHDSVLSGSRTQLPIRRILEEVDEVLTGMGIPFWIQNGLVLGAVRDGTIIPWDEDIDIGTSDELLPRMVAIAEAFSQRGYVAYYSQLESVIALWKDGVAVDFNFWRFGDEFAQMPISHSDTASGRLLYYLRWVCAFSPQGSRAGPGPRYAHARFVLSKLVSSLPYAARRRTVVALAGLGRRFSRGRGMGAVPARFFRHPTPIGLEDRVYLGPADPEDYLLHTYGPGWRLPDRGWSHSTNEAEASENQPDAPAWDYR
jgi:hypothetical protein